MRNHAVVQYVCGHAIFLSSTAPFSEYETVLLGILQAPKALNLARLRLGRQRRWTSAQRA